MSKRIRTVSSLFIFGALFSWLPMTHAQDSEKVTNKDIKTNSLQVLELFTSQGCHSCPPADNLLGKLGQNPNHVTISCHVTYWDYLGWKDSFSQHFCDKRQSQYNTYLKNSSNYTPQMVVNGQLQGVGSRQYRVENMLFRAKKRNALVDIDLSRNSRSLLINLENLFKAFPKKRETELSILGIGKTQAVTIPRGENGGKELTYHNPLLHGYTKELENLESARLIENLKEHADIEKWVVLAHDIRTGAIIGAGQLDPS